MSGFLRSSILSKVVVALTGAYLVIFIIIHTWGQIHIYMGADAMNQYGIDLRKQPEFLLLARILLIVSFVLHIIATLNLVRKNRAANPQKYAKKGYENSTLASRSMAIAGILIIFFLIYHLLHFTWGKTHPEHYAMIDSLGRPDVFSQMVLAFRSPLLSIFYIVAMIFLGLHLSHGVQSMFQTLGIYGDNITPKLRLLSRAFALLISLSLLSIPVAVLLGLIGGNVQ